MVIDLATEAPQPTATSCAIVAMNASAATPRTWAALPSRAALLVIVLEQPQELLRVPAALLHDRLVLHWCVESLQPSPATGAAGLLHAARASGKGVATAHGISWLLQSITRSQKEVLRFIVEAAEVGKTLSLDALLKLCKSSLTATSMPALKALLTEVVDHGVVELAPGGTVELKADLGEVKAALRMDKA